VAVDEADQWDVRSVRLKVAALIKGKLKRFRKRVKMEKKE
jgi:phosphatidylinositol glycan class T